MSDDTNTPVETPADNATEKKGRQMSFTVLDDGRIQASFGEGVDPLHLNPSEVPEATQLAAITEGLIARSRSYTSKLIDADRTPEALRVVIEKAFSNLKAGIWKVERVAGAGEAYTIEVQAALLFRQKRAASKGETCADTLADTAANWATLTDEQKAQVKALPRYQQSLAEIKATLAAERAAKLAKKADQAEENSPF